MNTSLYTTPYDDHTEKVIEEQERFIERRAMEIVQDVNLRMKAAREMARREMYEFEVCCEY